MIQFLEKPLLSNQGSKGLYGGSADASRKSPLVFLTLLWTLFQRKQWVQQKKMKEYFIRHSLWTPNVQFSAIIGTGVIENSKALLFGDKNHFVISIYLLIASRFLFHIVFFGPEFTFPFHSEYVPDAFLTVNGSQPVEPRGIKQLLFLIPSRHHQ